MSFIHKNQHHNREANKSVRINKYFGSTNTDHDRPRCGHEEASIFYVWHVVRHAMRKSRGHPLDGRAAEGTLRTISMAHAIVTVIELHANTEHCMTRALSIRRSGAFERCIFLLHEQKTYPDRSKTCLNLKQSGS